MCKYLKTLAYDENLTVISYIRYPKVRRTLIAVLNRSLLFIINNTSLYYHTIFKRNNIYFLLSQAT